LSENSAEDSANPVPVDRNDLPDPFPILSAAEVHVWHANLDAHSAEDLQLLAADEVSRANQFHFARDKNHYIVARGLLRRLLAGYLDTDAAELRLEYAEKGKPALKSGVDASDQGSLRFNLAHSHGRAIYAFSHGRELGVDLEFMREEFAVETIAERFFSPTEIVALRAVPPELRQQAFFDCWTRKEAYLKARGEGLSMPLDEFDVSLAPGEAAALLRNHKEPEEAARWAMRSIPVASGHAAALVVEGHDWALRTFSVGFHSDTEVQQTKR
jgi:4'-phosphopantetheinyl transferase